VRLRKMARNDCLEARLSGTEVVLSRTGYTGEEMGFEIFVHPDRAPQLWNAILSTGRDRGVAPIGLGARDSLRIESGLPLYGHELMGPYNISPGGAGFGNFVKLNKPFFIGKAAYLQSERTRDRVVVQFKVPAKGSKPVKLGDVLVDARGGWAGNVTSAAVDANGLLTGLAYVAIPLAKPGPIDIYPLPHDTRPMVTPKDMGPGKRLVPPVQVEII
jgi:glycine hydroxymethyltransferase